MAKHLTRKKVEATLDAIKDQFKAHIEAGYEPVIVEKWESYSGSIVRWAIMWEEGAPYDWALNAKDGGLDDEMSALAGKAMYTPEATSWPKGVWCEPYNGYVLALYPES